MNYLAHQYIARRVRPEPNVPELFFAGNLLPDLLAISGDGRLRTAGDHSGALADGVRLHLHTDKQFHGLGAFHAVQAKASQLLLSATWEAPPHRRFFLAHVMTELALDASILVRHPDLPDDLYGTLAGSMNHELIAQAATMMGHTVPNLSGTVARFIESRFLYQYATPEGLASSLTRVSHRAGIPNFSHPADVATLARIFDEFGTILATCTDELLALPVAKTGLNTPAPVVQ